ncbi:hypothetical protein AAEO56_18215 [Flavobacterium sp. DGU11]|uniref:Uncharacterized protein n=1 Tax=Flavobacterium arundinis TaxID=3139143 RepID=A0ABU9I1C2_9FLAO
METELPNTEPLDIEQEKLVLEKYKTKIELYKWLIGSVGLVLLTTIIDYGFRDRAAGLQEIQQYDKYITDLIVLNKEPGQKRMLAQFFSNVTPSEKLKKGWCKYYIEVDKEYQKFIAPVLKNDSVIKKEYNNLLTHFDSTNTGQKEKLEVLKTQIEENKRLINPDIILPSGTIAKDYNSAIQWEKRGFSYLLNKDVDNAIVAFQNSENAYTSFHQVYEIANYLKKNRAVLKDGNSESWKKTFDEIGKDYNWKMPDEIRNKLLNNKP